MFASVLVLPFWRLVLQCCLVFFRVEDCSPLAGMPGLLSGTIRIFTSCCMPSGEDAHTVRVPCGRAAVVIIFRFERFIAMVYTAWSSICGCLGAQFKLFYLSSHRHKSLFFSSRLLEKKNFKTRRRSPFAPRKQEILYSVHSCC